MRIAKMNQELIENGRNAHASMLTYSYASAKSNIRYIADWVDGSEVRQPKSMDCWITCVTMLSSWKEETSYTIDEIARRLGEPFLSLYNNNAGLHIDQEPELFEATGLTGQYGYNFSIEGFSKLLKDYGPLIIIGANRARSTRWGLHARILYGIDGDGTSVGTTMYLVDPASGKKVEESFKVFNQKYERLVSELGYVHHEVVHWPDNVKVQVQMKGRNEYTDFARSVQYSIQQGILSHSEGKSILLSFFQSRLRSIAFTAIPAVHLDSKGTTRKLNRKRPFRLDEAGRPNRQNKGSVSELTDILDWLDVENAQHLRYQPTKTKTYCNIYAYDYCTLAGAYMPRVFWTNNALKKMEAGQQIKAQYAKTVTELTANALVNWFKDRGGAFGWSQPSDLNDMQQQVNQGAVGVIVGYKNPHGHITVVVPETGSRKAKRDAAGKVVVPLQSQAGRNNLKYHTRSWWSSHTPHGFYICK